MTTAIFVTARLKSTRLPRKVLKPVAGKPMIVHLLDRLKLTERPDRIVICTSPLEQDDPLVDVARRAGVDYFRGDPDDVLQRLTDAAAHFGVDTVVSCTADNPFVDPEYIDRLVDYHLAHGYDYTRSEGLPFGTFAYALSYPAMVRACHIKATVDTEVWGGYFTQTGQFNWGEMVVTDPAVRWPELRLTVDTPADFELVERIFDELYRPGHPESEYPRTPLGIFPLRDIVALLRRRPDLVAINSGVQQQPGRPIELRPAPGNDHA